MNSLRLRPGFLLGVFGLLTTCAPAFDTTRQPTEEGTLGEEVFKTVCERVDVSENPGDIDFEQARPVCAGQTPASDAGMSIGPKVRAMADRRAPIALAVDRGIPTALHQAADAMLVNLLPLYG